MGLGAQQGVFKDRGQISMTGHIHFQSFIQYHVELVELVKCDFFPSCNWYKMYL